MNTYELIMSIYKEKRTMLLQAGIFPADMARNLEIYEEYHKLLDTEKKLHAAEITGDEYGIGDRQILRIIKKYCYEIRK